MNFHDWQRGELENHKMTQQTFVDPQRNRTRVFQFFHKTQLSTNFHDWTQRIGQKKNDWIKRKTEKPPNDKKHSLTHKKIDLDYSNSLQNKATNLYDRYIWRGNLENDKKHSLTHNEAEYSNNTVIHKFRSTYTERRSEKPWNDKKHSLIHKETEFEYSNFSHSYPQISTIDTDIERKTEKPRNDKKMIKKSEFEYSNSSYSYQQISIDRQKKWRTTKWQEAFVHPKRNRARLFQFFSQLSTNFHDR